MKSQNLETPVAPHGDASHFDTSFDTKWVAFSSRVPARSSAWTTNLDIYLVPSDGSTPPVSISSFNLGSDSHPKFSPDGTK